MYLIYTLSSILFLSLGIVLEETLKYQSRSHTPDKENYYL